MDEHTDLIDPNTLSKNSGLPHKTHPPVTEGSKEAKPDSTFKLLDENITTEKSSLDKGFPRKPVNNTSTDPDVPSILKKPSAGKNSSPKDPDCNLLKEGDETVTSVPVSPNTSTYRTNENCRIVPKVVVTDGTGGLVQGSDGPPGPMGPPGKPVSTVYLRYLLF